MPPPVAAMARNTLLGERIGFPIGIPSSAQTATSDWIDFWARKGYNLLTYKTVRSIHRAPHPPPNLFFMPQLKRALFPDEEILPDIEVDEQMLADLDHYAVTTAHSFGVPSPGPEEWQPDVERTVRGLAEGQLLLVAVLGTSDDGNFEELKADFVKVACLAEEAGAKAVELNLHCAPLQRDAGPKVPIGDDPEATVALVKAVRAALRPDTRLVIKLGYLDRPRLEAILVPLASEGRIDGVSGVNPIRAAMQMLDDGRTAFYGRVDDPHASRLQAGVSGIAIQRFGFDFVQSVASVRRERRLEFDIIAMGGVMNVTDVRTYFGLGANAVQSATGHCSSRSWRTRPRKHWRPRSVGARPPSPAAGARRGRSP